MLHWFLKLENYFSRLVLHRPKWDGPLEYLQKIGH